MKALDKFDQPIVNNSGEIIPGSAVVEVRAPGYLTRSGRDYWTVGRPSSAGKVYLVNSPLPIAAGGVGMAARVDRSPGVHVLVDPELSASALSTNAELGPVADKWWLAAGSGFFVIGNQTGAPPSQPGFPPSPSTIRIRVFSQAVAETIDEVTGLVNQTVTPLTPTFVINKLIIVSGKDPRQNPGDENENLLVNNTYRKAYVWQQDRVRARRNKSNNQWDVIEEASGSPMIRGRLKTDLTSAMSSVVVIVENSTDTGTPVGAELPCFNPTDPIRYNPQPNTTYYQFIGNAGGKATATKYPQGWYLETVQTPTRVPIQPSP